MTKHETPTIYDRKTVDKLKSRACDIMLELHRELQKTHPSSADAAMEAVSHIIYFWGTFRAEEDIRVGEEAKAELERLKAKRTAATEDPPSNG